MIGNGGAEGQHGEHGEIRVRTRRGAGRARPVEEQRAEMEANRRELAEEEERQERERREWAEAKAREDELGPLKRSDRCPNCEERYTEKLVEGWARGKLGGFVPVWLCAWCAAGVQEEREAREKAARRRRRKPKPGHISTGYHGEEIMGLAYRVGGFTPRQLAEVYLVENPGRFKGRRERAEARAREELEIRHGDFEDMDEKTRDLAVEEVIEAGTEAARTAARKSAGDDLRTLKRARLMETRGVWRKHAVGERGGGQEMFYLLTEKGAVWGGSLNGVLEEAAAKKAYRWHQLPRRAEHSAYRNDVYIRMLGDFALSREAGDAGVNAPGEVVKNTAGDLTGESYPGYPLVVGRLPSRGNGIDEPRTKREWERLFPDGRLELRWGDGLECAMDIEAERESWGPEGARKMDRYGAYWAKLYRRERDDVVRAEEARREAEGKEAKAGVPPEGSPDAEDLEEIKKRIRRIEAARSEPQSVVNMHGGSDAPRVVEARRLLSDDEWWASRRALEEAQEAVEAIRRKYITTPPGVPFPEGIRPVLFIHQTRTWSRGARTAMRDRRFPAPRFDAFREFAVEVAKANRVAAGGGRESAEALAARVRREVDSLIVFTSWEELGAGLGLDGTWEGGTLRAVYRPLSASSEDVNTTLRETAELRARMG